MPDPDQLFTLPDGVQIPHAAAAACFPDLHTACDGQLSRRELLQLVTTSHLPNSTAKLPPEQAQRYKERLQEVTNLITAARNGPPVLKDWLLLYQLTWPSKPSNP